MGVPRRGKRPKIPTKDQLARAFAAATTAAHAPRRHARNAGRKPIRVDAAHAASVEKTSGAAGATPDATLDLMPEAALTLPDDSDGVQPDATPLSGALGATDLSNVIPIRPSVAPSLRYGARPLASDVRDLFFSHPDLIGVLACDQFRGGAIVKRKAPPWRNGTAGQWTRKDSSEARLWFTDYYGAKVSRDDMEDAVESAAGSCTFNSLADSLRRVEWDGTPRLDRWLVDYCGAQPTPLNLAYGRRFIISAIARAMDPGSTVQHVLILEGRENIGKTRVARAIAGKEFYCDAAINMSNEMNAPLLLPGVWFYVFDELAALRSATIEQIGQFIGQDRDEYVLKHRVEKVRTPRSVVFVGTTKRHEYLRDPDGNRKFWCIRVGEWPEKRVIDVEGVERDRDQILAEALRAYDMRHSEDEAERVSARWWIGHDAADSALVEASSGSVETRLEIDEWETPISQWIVKHWSMITENGYTTAAEILKGALKLPVSQWGTSERRRVAQILMRFGWERGARARGQGGRLSPYTPPPTMPRVTS